MKTLYIECNMGAAGDMLMGALSELIDDADGFVARMNSLGLPGVHVEPVYMSLMLGLILGGFFYIVRPLLKLLTIPIGCLTMGLFSLALDTGVIYLMSLYLPGFSLDGPEWALAIAGILMILRCPVLR